MGDVHLSHARNNIPRLRIGRVESNARPRTNGALNSHEYRGWISYYVMQYISENIFEYKLELIETCKEVCIICSTLSIFVCNAGILFPLYEFMLRETYAIIIYFAKLTQDRNFLRIVYMHMFA